MILLTGKLYKTQTEIMTWDARSFTRSNHTESCRLPVPHLHKLGWQKTHTFHKLSQNSAAPIIIIGDSISTGLRAYQHIWKSYFKDALKLGISGDRVEKARDISLQHTTFVIIHWGTNNVEQSQKLLPSLLACYQETRHTLFGGQKSMKQTIYWKRKM